MAKWLFLDEVQYNVFLAAMDTMKKSEDFAHVLEEMERARLAMQLRQIIDAKIAAGEIKVSHIEVNEKGHLAIDKEKNPELYDWAVNG